jgi:hypothetical protein
MQTQMLFTQFTEIKKMTRVIYCYLDNEAENVSFHIISLIQQPPWQKSLAICFRKEYSRVRFKNLNKLNLVEFYCVSLRSSQFWILP